MKSPLAILFSLVPYFCGMTAALAVAAMLTAATAVSLFSRVSRPKRHS